MNKKGFTLVEMLLVVVLIAVVTSITMPNIYKMLNKSKTDKVDEYLKIVKENLKMYNIDNKEDWVSDGTYAVEYNDLKKINPDISNIEDICTSSILEITKQDNKYTYKVCLNCIIDGKESLYGDCE